MTTEDKAELKRRFIENLDGILTDHTARKDREIVDFYTNVFVSICLDFHNSQPPNLDLKCTAEFELLSEPKPIDFKSDISDQAVSYVECKEYQDALTFRERIDELVKKNRELESEMSQFLIMLEKSDNQITQLTEENQELKTRLVETRDCLQGELASEYKKLQAVTKENQELKTRLTEELGVGDLLAEQLQAAEDRIKEACELLIDPLTGLCPQQFENFIGKEVCAKIELLTNKQ